ncbi:MAG: thermopsin family protease [Thermoplasmata archaeon]
MNKFFTFFILLILVIPVFYSYPNTNNNANVLNNKTQVRFVLPPSDVRHYANPVLLPSQGPFPVGVADYGLRGGTPYAYNTTGFEGIANITNITAGYFSAGSSYTGYGNYTLQLNTVVTRVNINGDRNLVFWTQNVIFCNKTRINGVYYEDILFMDNIWNFSNSAGLLSNSSFYSSNGSVWQYQGMYYYYAQGPEYLATFPFTVSLSTVSGMVHGDSTVWFNYSLKSSKILNATTLGVVGNGTFVNGSFDRAVFNSTNNSVFPLYEVNGYNYNPIGLYYDSELVFGGPGGGAYVNMVNSSGGLRLLYYNSRFKSFLPVVSSYNVGGDTAEAATDINVKGVNANGSPYGSLGNLNTTYAYNLWRPYLTLNTKLGNNTWIIYGKVFPGTSAVYIHVISNTSLYANITTINGYYSYNISRIAYMITVFVNQTVNGYTILENTTSFLGEYGDLYVHIYPLNATIYLNSTPYRAYNGYANISALPGVYLMNATSYGYHNYEKNVKIIVNQTVYMNVTLSPVLGYINGTVDPINATLTINSQIIKIFNGNFSDPLMFGKYYVNASLQGYYKYSKIIYLSPGNKIFLNVTLNLIVGWLVCNVTPSNAVVRIDGRQIAFTGNINLTLKTGYHNLMVSLQGYYPYNHTILITMGNTTSVDISLIKIVGWLVINVVPQNSTVYLNTTRVVLYKGFANITLVPGKYFINISYLGYQTLSKVIIIRGGSVEYLNVTLPKNSLEGLYNNAIEYSGIAVVIAIIAVVGLMVFKRRKNRTK